MNKLGWFQTTCMQLKRKTLPTSKGICITVKALQSFPTNDGFRANVMRIGNSYLESVDPETAISAQRVYTEIQMVKCHTSMWPTVASI